MRAGSRIKYWVTKRVSGAWRFTPSLRLTSLMRGMCAFFVMVTLAVLAVPGAALDAQHGGEELARFGGNDFQHGMVNGRISLHNVDDQAVLAIWLNPILGPLDPPHHFYDMDLPPTSFSGLATNVVFPAEASPPLAGAWQADKPTHLHLDLSIYADGPLTLTRRIGLGSEPLATAAILDYMACSADACRPAVTGLEVPIVLPSAASFGVAVYDPASFAQPIQSSPAPLADERENPAAVVSLPPASTLTPEPRSKAVESDGKIAWLHPTNVAELEGMIAEAHAAGLPALLDFTGPSCVNCQVMAKTVFQLDPIRAAWNAGVPIEINTDAYAVLGQWQVEQFNTATRPLYVHVSVAGESTLWQRAIFGVNDRQQVNELDQFLRTGLAQGGAEEDQASAGWWGFIALALAGGLFTLVMPCTYPMIPLTVNFFVKQSENGRSLFPLAAAYALGIEIFFILIGVVVAILFQGAIGSFAGSPWINAVIGVAFVVLGLSLLDVFFLRLPTSFNKLLGGGSGGYIGALLMGLTFAITAFTCTAPFAGAVLASGVNGEGWARPVIGMAIYASVIAVPFFVLAMMPGVLARLPRAGSWMHEFKVAGGIIEIAAAFKFLAIADFAWGWGIFTRDITLLAWSVFSLALAAYILGWWRMQGDQKVETVGVLRLFLALAVAMLGVWLLAGYWDVKPFEKIVIRKKIERWMNFTPN